MSGPVWHRIEVGVLPDAGVEIDHRAVERAIGEAVGPWTMTYAFRCEPIVPRVAGRQDQPLHVRWSDDGRAIRRWGNEPFDGSRTYYPATCLETAACLWEAVLDMLACGDVDAHGASDEDKQRGEQVRAAREELGTSHLRLTVLGWVDAVDESWRAWPSLNDGQDFPGAFDWEFVPDWLATHVDWSDPQRPAVRS